MRDKRNIARQLDDFKSADVAESPQYLKYRNHPLIIAKSSTISFCSDGKLAKFRNQLCYSQVDHQQTQMPDRFQ